MNIKAANKVEDRMMKVINTSIFSLLLRMGVKIRIKMNPKMLFEILKSPPEVASPIGYDSSTPCSKATAIMLKLKNPFRQIDVIKKA